MSLKYIDRILHPFARVYIRNASINIIPPPLKILYYYSNFNSIYGDTSTDMIGKAQYHGIS